MSYVCAVEVSESRGDPRCDVESRCVVKMMSVSAACVNAGVGVNSRPECMRLLLTVCLSVSQATATTSNGANSPKIRKPRIINPTTIKHAVLCTLAVQNACQMLSMRYSKMPSQPKYLSTTAVVSAEVVKIVLSFAVLFSQMGTPAVGFVWRAVFVAWKDTLLVGVPAFIYLVQNNLLYVATTHLDAATCQVAYQLKLLTTAFFTVTMLKRHISNRRWAALGLLFVGVVMVQAPAGSSGAPAKLGQSPVLGMAAVFGACFLFGLAGVWLERIIKQTADVPIWVRNIQLGVVSLALGLGSVALLDGAAVAERGFFQGYTWLTASVVLQVSAGRLLLGLLMKYADHLLMGFATSLSIILSSVVSTFIPAFGFEPGLAFFCGSALVIAATIIYSWPAAVIAVGDVGIV